MLPGVLILLSVMISVTAFPDGMKAKCYTRLFRNQTGKLYSAFPLVLHSQGIWNGDAIMVNPIEIEGFRTPGHTIHDVTLRDCTLPQDASIRLALYDELTLQNIHSAAE